MTAQRAALATGGRTVAPLQPDPVTLGGLLLVGAPAQVITIKDFDGRPEQQTIALATGPNLGDERVGYRFSISQNGKDIAVVVSVFVRIGDYLVGVSGSRTGQPPITTWDTAAKPSQDSRPFTDLGTGAAARAPYTTMTAGPVTTSRVRVPRALLSGVTTRPLPLANRVPTGGARRADPDAAEIHPTT